MIWLLLILGGFYIAACRWPRLWCGIGMHHWDQPGGHCEDCGKCDDFFGGHDHS